MSGNGRPRGEQRSSALWGTGNRGGDSRSNALSGKGGRGLVTALVAVLVVAAPLAAGARKNGASTTYVDPVLIAKANSTPNALVKVIIQDNADGFDGAKDAFERARSLDKEHSGEQLTRKLRFVASAAVTLKAKRVLQLAHLPNLTIAFVDSGIEKNRADFDMGARVIDDVVITQLEPNSSGDGRGHGTFVAGIAAGSAKEQAGAAPQTNLISLDVMDDNGMARTSDVIAAAEWIYKNRASKNIRVANISLHSTMPSNFINDPLDN